MLVISKPGTKTPREGQPREYITDDVPVDVPDDSSYYRRLVRDGSLLSAEVQKRGSAEAKKKDKGGKD